MPRNSEYTNADAAHDWDLIVTITKGLDKSLGDLYSRDDEGFARREGFDDDMKCDVYSLMLGAQRMAAEYRRLAEEDEARAAA